ncbi:recombinase A [compost metagenome]
MGNDMVGNRTRIKVVKNKVAPPFKQADIDIMYGEGISREGSLVDIGTEMDIVNKSGAWYSYEGERLGQGRENAKQFLKENQNLALTIENKIREASNLSTLVAAPTESELQAEKEEEQALLEIE